MVENLGSILL